MCWYGLGWILLGIINDCSVSAQAALPEKGVLTLIHDTLAKQRSYFLYLRCGDSRDNLSSLEDILGQLARIGTSTANYDRLVLMTDIEERAYAQQE